MSCPSRWRCALLTGLGVGHVAGTGLSSPLCPSPGGEPALSSRGATAHPLSCTPTVGLAHTCLSCLVGVPASATEEAPRHPRAGNPAPRGPYSRTISAPNTSQVSECAGGRGHGFLDGSPAQARPGTCWHQAALAGVSGAVPRPRVLVALTGPGQGAGATCSSSPGQPRPGQPRPGECPHPA